MLPRPHKEAASARRLVFRHRQRLARAETLGDDAPAELKPGQLQLYSYYVPGLQMRTYSVDVTQNITAGSEHQPLTSKQSFTVLGPRFALPDNAVHSVYPPQGQAEDLEILPHVAFNDPTFPWERLASPAADAMKPPSTDYFVRNRVPWLAVLVFTKDELQLSAEQLGPTGIFSKVSGMAAGAKQSPTFAVNMKVKDLPQVAQTYSAVPYDAPTDGDATSDIIFVPRTLFNALFTTYNADGSPVQPPQKSADVYRYRYLAHRRDINTQGMAVSGGVMEDDTGSFGVVFSHRTGPFSTMQPTAVYVHLVNIEAVESLNEFPVKAATPYVAMSSLLSWSYICNPPSTPNVHDLLVSLSTSMTVMSPVLDSTIQTAIAAKPMGSRLLQRLAEGYTLTRYRTKTGETTACFTRGPFIPCDVAYPLTSFWPKYSMSGQNFQILDPELGIMDITYSAAWQLGRTMAIADAAFVAALVRVRKQIIDRATVDAEEAAMTSLTRYKTKPELLRSLPDMVNKLGRLHTKGLHTTPDSLAHRWRKPLIAPVDLSRTGDNIRDSIWKFYEQAALEVASTPKPNDPTQPSDIAYDEMNTPFSPDWVIVLRWIMDKLFLSSIPSHILIPDASFLPPESLRFFKVDQNWMDAMVDGSLSLANHMDPDDDKVRDAIKKALNRYISPDPTSPNKPHPIPHYGCYLRSAVVKQFPDLIVDVSPEPTDPPILLRHEVVDAGTMLCLFSEIPAKTTTASTTGLLPFTMLKFTQPPHQQSFRAATKIDNTTFTRDYKKAPTDPDNEGILKPGPITWPRGQPLPDHGSVYQWTQIDPDTKVEFEVRTLLLEQLASDYHSSLLAQEDKAIYNDQTATSALMAYCLNNPSYMLEMDMNAKPSLNLLKALGSVHAARQLPTVTRKAAPLPVTPKAAATSASKLPKAAIAVHYRTSPAPVQIDPPPHHPKTVVRSPRVPRAIGAPKPPSGGPSTAPAYNYYFWSLDDIGVPGNPGEIPAYSNNMAQDLVFSITLTNQPLDWNLEMITITVPMGNPITSPEQNPGPLMRVPYTGPGATMLSNLRFYPLVNYSQDQQALVISLVPRATKGWVPVAWCTELSFLLSSVVVNVSDPSTVPVVMVVPQVKEYYVGYEGDPLTPQQPDLKMTLKYKQQS